MRFNKHSPYLEGQHAFLSASKYHWIRYTEEQLAIAYEKYQAAARGTELHEYACMAIRLGIRQPKTRDPLSMYINDAIGYQMTPEQMLFYSDNCFGTADTISFKTFRQTSRQPELRIHDYKSGSSRVSMDQLMVYVALFCLEYKIKPVDIFIELRIYQLDGADNVRSYIPSPEEIINIMDTIVAFDRKIEEMRSES